MRTLKKLLVLFMLFVAGNMLSCNVQHQETGRKQLFDLNWKFNYGNHSLGAEIDLKDDNWRNLDLPHDWSKDSKLVQPMPANIDIDRPVEVAWYRKQFEIPKNWMERSIWIEFEGIGDENEVFLNGLSIVAQKSQNGAFQTNLDSYLNYSGKNVIAVRVAAVRDSTGHWKPDSGIFRHVWLLVKEKNEFKK